MQKSFTRLLLIFVATTLTDCILFNQDVIRPDSIEFLSIPLPEDYQQTQQNENIQNTHNLQIFAEHVLLQYRQPGFPYAKKAFDIAAYYFSRVIKVQSIEKQRLFLPQNYDCSLGVQAHEYGKYANYGFDSENIDLVVFFSNFNYGSENRWNMVSGACVIQRRPLYGYLNFYFNWYLSYKTHGFHENIHIIMHGIIHILGFNSAYYLDYNQPQNRLQNVVIDNSETLFFQNPLSKKRKKRVDVIRRNIYNNSQLIFITPQIKQFAYQFFKCQGKIQKSDAGFPVAYQIKEDPSTGQHYTVISNHFASATYFAEQLMVFDQFHTSHVARQRIPRDNLNKMRISELTLRFLRDTGFYQEVIISQEFTDQFLGPQQDQFGQIRTFNSIDYDGCKNTYNQELDWKQNCQFQRNEYGQILPKFDFMCDIRGQSLRKTGYAAQYNVSQENLLCQSSIFTCKRVNANKPKCLMIQRKSQFQAPLVQDFCLDITCFIEDNKLKLRTIVGQTILILCGGQQKESYIQQYDITYLCPQNIALFCESDLCLNYCSFQGICIRNKCLNLQKKTQFTLRGLTIPHNSAFIGYYYDFGLDQAIRFCQIGCLICQDTQSQAQQPNCLQPLIGFVLKSNQFNQLLYPLQCPENCQICAEWDTQDGTLNNICQKCLPRHFLLSGTRVTCLACPQQQCTDCQLQGANLICVNCIQGYLINRYGFCDQCLVLLNKKEQTIDTNCAACYEFQQGEYACIRCIDGYFLIDGNCFQCLPSKGRCKQQPNVVQKCLQQYFYNDENDTCQTCPEGCYVCRNNIDCDACLPGYISVSPQQTITDKQYVHCKKECNFPCTNCSTQNPNICNQCADKFNLNTGSKTCQPDYSCKGDCEPFDCPFANNLKSSSQDVSICQECPIKNCVLCDLYANFDAKTCKLCARGFYPSQAKSLCIQCPSNCQTCYSDAICLSCAPGYTNPKKLDQSIITQICLPCTHNCQTCSGSPHQCTTCINGYELFAWKCFPKGNSINLNFTIVSAFQTIIRSKRIYQIVEILKIRILDLLSHQINLVSSLILDISEGSVTINFQLASNNNGIISRIKQSIDAGGKFFTDSELDCVLFIQASQRISAIQSIVVQNQTFTIISSRSQSKNCSSVLQRFYAWKNEITSQPGSQVSIELLIGIIVGLVVLFLIIFILLFIFMKRKTQKIILKYEEIKSKGQYSSTSDITKQAY